MANNTVAQMTRSELKEMLAAVVETTVEEKRLVILGDPDEGFELREAVRDRLIRQRDAVASCQYDQVVVRMDVDLSEERARQHEAVLSGLK